jgi:hypothetical protein
VTSPWDRRLNRPGAEQRVSALRDRFRRLGRKRVPKSVAVIVIGLVVVATLALVQGFGSPQGAPWLSQAPQSQRTTPYRNCAEARAAGEAPLARGHPRYGEHLDSDSDGWACEPYYGR